MRLFASITVLLAAAPFVLATACSAEDREGLAERCDEDNDVSACRAVAEMRLLGREGGKDKKGGRLAYEKACKLGDAASCGTAGDLVYARRDGNARYWLQRACEMEHAESCADLAWMVEHGEGGPRDEQKGERLYRLACEGGDATGCFFLALRESSKDNAAAALSRACALGDRVACELSGRRASASAEPAR
ncbi:MAG: tetratricopeptide repeat protein [Polyangia bacterium]